MRIALIHLTLVSPDELIPYWFVSHDFAGALGLEYSSDAAQALTQAIGPKLARIDYEADRVTVRISGGENVIPTLMAIYDYLGWDKAELADVARQVSTFKRPRRRRVNVGNVFLVPFAPDLFGLGQVLDINYKCPTVAVFTCVGTAQELSARDVAACQGLTILHIHGNALYKGEWPIVGSAPVRLDPDNAGSTFWGGDGPIVDLLLAYTGRGPWKQGYGVRDYLRKLMLPSASPPPG